MGAIARVGAKQRPAMPRANKTFVRILTAVLALMFLAASTGVSVHGQTFTQPTIGFPIPFSALLLLAFAVCFVRNRTTLLPRIPLGVVIFSSVLAIMAMASSYWCAERAQSAMNWLAVQIAVLYFTFYAVFTLKRMGVEPLRFFIQFLIGFAIASLVFAVTLLLRGSIWVGFATIEHFPNYMRLYGWYGNPNLFGSAMGVATLAAYTLLMEGRSIAVARVFLFLCLFGGVLFAGSKAVLASVIAAMLFAHAVDMLPQLRPGLPIRGKPVRLAIVGGFVLVLLAPIAVGFSDVVEEVLKLDALDITSGRVDIWQHTSDLLSKSGDMALAFGHGYEYHIDKFGVSAHSFYVRAIVEHGVVFLAIFIIANISLASVGISRMRSSDPADALIGRFALVIIMFMLLRNIATPSFLQVRVENIVYLFSVAFLFSSPGNRIVVSGAITPRIGELRVVEERS